MERKAQYTMDTYSMSLKNLKLFKKLFLNSNRLTFFPENCIPEKPR